MATLQPLPYELYSDAPGTLFVKHEWEAANAAHPVGTDFGDVPAGWPRKLEGPLTWDGNYLQAHCTVSAHCRELQDTDYKCSR